MTDSRSELFQLYEMAQREYHLVVRLGHSRVALYLSLSVALIIALSSWSRSGLLVALAYLVGAAIAVLFALAIGVQHSYYRSARTHLQAIEADLQLQRPIATTPGQKGDTGRPRLRITGATAAVLYLIAGVDVVSAVVAMMH